MEDYCERCGAKLNQKKIVWLELNSETGKYYLITDPPSVPEEDSQGAFPFGSACARHVLKEQPYATGKEG